MLTIQIPEINFPRIIQNKAEYIFNDVFGGRVAIRNVAVGIRTESDWIDKLKSSIYKIPSSDRIAVTTKIISIFANYQTDLKNSSSNESGQILDYIEEALYQLYGVLMEFGVDVRQDLFSKDESDSIHRQLNSIIDALPHNGYTESLQEIKEAINQLKDAVLLGKNSFRDKILGFLFQHTGEKILDGVWPSIVAIAHEVFTKYFPKLESLVNNLLNP
ncbi:hypothetical protein GCM10023231_24710 [Olivibacter ginsenosidimutans]|uniref:Uncharacterized protein n=1 Tax=Olivibacter ginsenosidimutans TaxID=1176537 RepID=A0ABP9BGZ8_9SPHI